ncbi:MAG: peptide chain release factor N(5)-glutamine methyltransferase [Bacteroidaceae bacterium]|nr:peptide chain release factor N(5)-glutamine methyltransferase [Bacteroidaceae bacterium]
MKRLIKQLRDELSPLYPQGEREALIRIVAMDLLKIGSTAFYLKDEITLDPTRQATLDNAIERLKKAEPIQYILGQTEFCDLTFNVNPSVLIPRPETSELVKWIVEENKKEQTNILDIGTGSGCIAISLAKMLPNAQVTAWDISPRSIETAESNNRLNGTKVTFVEQDIFTASEEATYDIIVSNPPYIKEVEKRNMQRNVLDWEPSIALFVPDNDPLLFYREIARKGVQLLKNGGKLYFEINREHGEETCNMLAEYGYTNIELRKDFADNDRMIRASL